MPAFVSPPCGAQSEEAQDMTWKSWLTVTGGPARASPRLSSQTPVQVDTITQPPLEAGNRPGLGAPEFTLKALAGPEASLSDYKGRPVLINFWSSWCKPCRSEMPDIVAAYRAHQESGLEVRSEERRVGKECRCRWWADQLKKKGARHVGDVHMVVTASAHRGCHDDCVYSV